MACYRFFEGDYSEVQDDTIDQYFFGSTRKYRNFWGIIIRIFREKEVLQEDCGKIVFQNDALTIVRTNYTGKNPEPFRDHMRSLGKEDYIYPPVDDYQEGYEDYWRYDGWGTFEYAAIELKIYLKHSQQRVGSIPSPELDAAILEQFETSRLMYYSGGFYVDFCVLEGISADLKSRRTFVSSYLCRYLKEGKVLDLQVDLKNAPYGYSRVDFDALFRTLPSKAVAKHKGMTIYNPRMSEEESKIYTVKEEEKFQLVTLSEEFLADLGDRPPRQFIEKEFARDTKLRILKVETYLVKTPHWWYLYEIENPKTDDTIKYALAKLRKNGYVYHL